MEALTPRDQAYCVLNGLPAIGPITLNRLLAICGGDPERVLKANRSELESAKGISKKAVEVLLAWERHFDLAKELREIASRGVDFISRDNSLYPRLLKEISDPPIGLYRMGKYEFSKPCVAIVGTRHCTLYGQSIAQALGKELAAMGFCVVSGMARGIDTYAHRGALEVNSGSTLCVLGNGIDIVYPPENVDLFKQSQADGAVISEFPLGRRADRQTFPMRNRLVSGLSEAVIVVESDEAGGSMITAKFAGEQGRLVCAVPGRIDQRASRGCHQLIRDGALLLSSLDDLLEELGHLRSQPDLGLDDANGPLDECVSLSGLAADLVKELGGGEAAGCEALAERLGVSIADVSVALLTLELEGWVAKRLDGSFELASQWNAKRG